MARPTKWRHVCSLPDNNRFGPLGVEVIEDDYIMMRLDEYETIRLIDLEGFTQAQCAQQMNVARTTVQAIYSRARSKLAKSLVDNKVLIIKGGEYKLCDSTSGECGPGCRHGKSRQNKSNKRLRDGQGPRGRGQAVGLRKRDKIKE